MQATPTIENVTLSVPNSDLSMLRLLSKRMGWKMKTPRKSCVKTPPCHYSEEEVVERVVKATADVEAGRGLRSHEEFKKQIRSWYN